MEHWAQKCDGAGVEPAEYAAVCQERDELKAALDGARLSMKALNEKLVEVTAERDALVKIVAKSIDGCDFCRNAGLMEREICEGLCFDCSISKECLCGNCTGGSNFAFVGAARGGE